MNFFDFWFRRISVALFCNLLHPLQSLCTLHLSMNSQYLEFDHPLRILLCCTLQPSSPFWNLRIGPIYQIFSLHHLQHHHLLEFSLILQHSGESTFNFTLSLIPKASEYFLLPESGKTQSLLHFYRCWRLLNAVRCSQMNWSFLNLNQTLGLTERCRM